MGLYFDKQLGLSNSREMHGTDKVGLCFDKRLGLSVEKPGLSMAVITFLDKPTLSVDKDQLRN